MKAQISRLSHDPAQRFSGVFHLQGGLVIDADLNEAALINRSRSEGIGQDAIGSGVPGIGGCVTITGGLASLKPGIVWAGGLRGMVTGPDSASGLALLKSQADLPGIFDPATLPAGDLVVFADLWHRSVTALEEPRIAEVALQGATPTFRTRLMAQLKVAPLDQLGAIRAGSGAWPQMGTGVLSASRLTDADSGDPCDPCATEIDIDAPVLNQLIRVEVIAITGSPSSPLTVTLAWSSENACETALAGSLPEGFAAPGFAYEHFTPASERSKGGFPAFAPAPQPVFRAQVDPSLPEAPVRRWDGSATFALTPSGAVTAPTGTVNASAGAGRVTITLETCRLDLELFGKAILPGDFWLVELRESVPQPIVPSPLPVGIRHAYAPLFRLSNRQPVPLSDPERRALSIPSLNNLPASHVSYSDTCPRLYEGAETVQQALDALCGLDATKIPWANSCPETFGDASTVAGALDALCGIGSDQGWMKYVFDWGVVCGLKVSFHSPDAVRLTPGTWLDWNGGFGTSPWKDDIILNLSEAKWVEEEADELCLGIVITDKKPEFVIAPHAFFTRPGDEGFVEKLLGCLSGSVRHSLERVLSQMIGIDQRRAREVIAVLLAGGEVPAYINTEAEVIALYDLPRKIAAALLPQIGQEAYDGLILRFQLLERHYGDIPDPKSQTRLKVMREETGLKFAAIFKVLRADPARCLCAALFPDCPHPEDPPRIPLARLRLKGRYLLGVCMTECRKQALTPRTMAYYLREHIGATILDVYNNIHKAPHGWDQIEEICCNLENSAGGIEIPGRKIPWERAPVGEVLYREREVAKYYRIAGLDKLAAREMLLGHGLDLREELALDTEEGRAALAGLMAREGLADGVLDSGNLVAPGDQVAMLTEGGKATGYLRLREGGGRYAFEQALQPTTSALGLDEFRALQEQAVTLETRIAGAQKLLGGLGAEIETARKSLTDLTATKAELMREIRQELPLRSLGPDAAVLTRLQEAGVITLGDLVVMKPAALTRLAKSAGLDAAALSALQKAATVRLGG